MPDAHVKVNFDDCGKFEVNPHGFTKKLVGMSEALSAACDGLNSIRRKAPSAFPYVQQWDGGLVVFLPVVG
jgi:hypothetical protein